MGSIPLPALDVRPPEDLLGQYAKVVNLKSMLQQQQTQQQIAPLQIQQEQQKAQIGQMQLQDQQAQTAALKEWDGKDIHDLPGLLLKHGGSANAVFGMRQQLLAQQKAAADADEATLKNQATQNDLIAGHLENVKSAPADKKQDAFDAAVTDLEQKGLLKPGQIPHQYPGDDKIDLLEKGFMGQKQITDQAMKQREVAAQELAAQARMKGAQKQPEGENPLGDVDSMNQALQDRFQVLNPGKPLPPYLALKQGATQKDFDRSDKMLQQIEQAKGTKAQQETANALRQQNLKGGTGALDGVAPHLVAPAAAAYDKAGQEYATAYQSAQNMSEFLQQARSGNKEAVKIVPLQGALEITTAQGVHRINRTEVDQFAGAGSAYDKLAGAVGGVLTGKNITDAVLKDMDSLQQIVTKNAKNLHANKVSVINKSYGSKFEPMNFEGGAASGMTRIKASDGSLHDIPTANLDKAKKIDPNLQVISH